MKELYFFVIYGYGLQVIIQELKFNFFAAMQGAPSRPTTHLVPDKSFVHRLDVAARLHITVEHLDYSWKKLLHNNMYLDWLETNMYVLQLMFGQLIIVVIIVIIIILAQFFSLFCLECAELRQNPSRGSYADGSAARQLSSYSCFPLATENRTLQAIISWFYSCATTRPPSSPITTVAPCCLLGLTSPDFDLASKQTEQPGYCGLDLI